MPFSTPISRRTLGAGLFATGLLGALAGCSSPAGTGTGASGASPAGGTIAGPLTLAVELDIQPLNPAKSQSAADGMLFTQAVYDTLLRFAPDGKVEPNIAEAYQANEDNTLFTLTLREGVTFSDGSPYDADAVKKHIDYMKTAGGSDSSRAAVMDVTAKDARTVEIRTAAPNGMVPLYLCWTVGSVAAPAQYDSPAADSEPIGAGPYLFDKDKSSTGNTYTFTRNPNYWNQGAFPFDSLVLKVMPDPNARLNALTTGQLSGASLSPQMAKAAEGAVQQGEGEATNQMFPTTSPAYRPDLADVYPYDLDRARALLAEAGYADGFEVTIPFVEGLTPSNALIVSQLKQLNITVTEVKLPGGNQGFQQILSGEFPMMWMVMGSMDPLSDVVGLVTPDAIWNPRHNAAPELTALLEEVQKAKPGEGKETWQAIGEYLIENAWFVPWYYGNAIFGLDAQTTAVTTQGSGYPYLANYRGR